jgi:hypothetical protein
MKHLELILKYVSVIRLILDLNLIKTLVAQTVVSP